MKKLFVFTAVLGFASIANATFTLNVNLGGMSGPIQGTDLPVNAIGVIVASGSDAIFPNATQINGKSIAQYADWGSDDIVIAVFAAITSTIDGSPASRMLGASQTIDYTLSSMTTKGINAGDKLAIYWFPAITDTNTVTSNFQGPPSQATITSGLNYGFYRSDVVANQTSGFTSIHSSNNAFVTPAEGANGFRIWALNTEGLSAAQEATSVNFNPSASDFTASLIVVPEPSTYAAIFGLIALGIAYRRRK